MQGLADGYFVLPYTIGNYFGSEGHHLKPVNGEEDAAREAMNAVSTKVDRLMGIKGKRSPNSFHRELGQICWDYCGMARNAEGLATAKERIQSLRGEFWENLCVPGDSASLNQSLENAGRVADFIEFAELMITDAAHREESCGGHFREEHQTKEGEARRNDEDFCYVAAWEFQGVGESPTLHKEQLDFDYVKLTQRSYK